MQKKLKRWTIIAFGLWMVFVFCVSEWPKEEFESLIIPGKVHFAVWPDGTRTVVIQGKEGVWVDELHGKLWQPPNVLVVARTNIFVTTLNEAMTNESGSLIYLANGVYDTDASNVVWSGKAWIGATSGSEGK